MEKVFPPDKVQTQPNQGRAKLIVSDTFSTFEIKENDFQKSNLLQSSIIFDNKANFDGTKATIFNEKRNQSKSFTFEQFDKINIPPNHLEAKTFANKIQNSIDSVSILPNAPITTQNTPSNENNNIDYSFSNLHILFSKDDYHPVPFHVSPVTSISSPFNNNIQIFDQNSKESNDESKYQISNDSVAYRQCIDLELNNNFEFSDISAFSAELIQNTIEETQNVEIYGTNEIDRHKPLSLDHSYDLFEQFEKSHNQSKNDNQLDISQLTSHEYEQDKSDSIQVELPIKETKSIKDHFHSKSSIQFQNVSRSTKSTQSTNLDENQRNKRKSKNFKFVKFKSINLINDENLNSNKIDNFQTITDKSKEKVHKNIKFSAFISDPICFTAKTNDDDDQTFSFKNSQIHHSSSMEFKQQKNSLEIKNINKHSSKELLNVFEMSPAESFTSETATNETEKNSNLNLSSNEIFDKQNNSTVITLAPILNKSNELQICSVAHADFNIKSKILIDIEDEKILPKFEESGFETLISIEKVKKLNQESTSVQTKTNELDNNNNLSLEKSPPNPVTPTKQTFKKLKHSEPDSTSTISTDSISVLSNEIDSNSVSKNITPQKKKHPKFTTSELSTMANIRYSPQVDNLKNSSTVFTESENTNNLSFQESEVATMTSINYVPIKVQIQESFPLSVERINNEENEINQEVNETNENPIPKFTTSDLSTMANIRYSPQKVETNHTRISSSEKDESPLSLIDDNETDLNYQKQKTKTVFYNIEESELMTIVSIKYDPSIPQIEEEQNQDQKQVFDKDSQINMNENENNQQNSIEEIEEEEEEIETDVANQTKLDKKISFNRFTTSEPSTMANIRFSPKSSYLNVSNDSTSFSKTKSNDQKQQKDKDLSFSTPKSKRDKSKIKLETNSPAFSTSEPSTMSSLQIKTVKRKLKESQASFIEVGEQRNDESEQEKEIFIIEEEEEHEESNIVNINESEMTTITSINYVPYKKQSSNKLTFSKQFIIENATNDENKEIQSNNEIVKTKPLTRKIIQTKPRKPNQIPLFSTSEPSTMSNFQSTETKRNLKESKITFFEVDEENKEEPILNHNVELPPEQDKEIETILIEEEEEENEQTTDKININESEMTTITAINYVPYQHHQKQENTLVLSEQIIIENIKNEPENENQKIEPKINQTLKIQPKPSKNTHNEEHKNKQIPSFSTSEPSTMANLQSTPNRRKLKESKISFVEIDEQNGNNSNSTPNFESKSKNAQNQIETQIEEEEEENEEININESEMTTITSINYAPDQQQQQENTLTISDRLIIEKENKTNENKDAKLRKETSKAHSKPNKNTQSNKNKSLKIPSFTTSEPSTLTNLQSSSSKESQSKDEIDDHHVDNEPKLDSNENQDKFESDNQTDDQIKQDDTINIEESDLITIASIKYDPSISQEKNQQQPKQDSEEQSDIKTKNVFSTPKTDKKTTNKFTTSEPQSYSSSTKQLSSNQAVKVKRKSNKKDKETETENKKEPSFETSEMVIISEEKSSSTTPIKDLNRSDFFTTEIQNNSQHNQIGIQNVHKNHSNFVANEPLTIENSSSNQASSSPHESKTIDYKPHFEFSELTTNANITTNNLEKAHLIQSESLFVASNSHEKTNELIDNKQSSDDQTNTKNYMVEKKELSQLVTFENHPAQNQLEQSKAVISESTLEIKKKKNKPKNKANNSIIANQVDFSNFTNDQENVDQQQTNNIKEKLLIISKNEDFFIDNSTNYNDNNNNNTIEEPKKKKKIKQKEVKLSSNNQKVKEENQLNRIETSVQTTTTTEDEKNTTLLQSGTFCIETNDKTQKNKKKQKQSISSQTDNSNQTDEKEERNPKSKANNSLSLTLSDSLSCDGNSNQNPPQFEQSLITTISNISMNTNEKQQKTVFHLSFQQNPSTIIEENENKNKNKNSVILFNSKSESFQSINQETNQLSVTNNQLNIPSESNKKFNSNETQTESKNSSFSINNDVYNFGLTNKGEFRKEKSFEIPNFESSSPTTILSLNVIDENHSDYLQTSTQISDDLNNKNDRNLETSPSVAQNFLDERNNLTSSGIKTVANIKSTEKQQEKENKSQNNLEFTSNEVVFANQESTNLTKNELVLHPQYELNKFESNQIEFETNEPSTIVSISSKENNSDLTIERNQTLFEINIKNDNEIKIKDLEISNQNKKESKQSSVNLSMSSNHNIFENMTNDKIHFDLSEITCITDLTDLNSIETQSLQNETTSFNLDEDVNKFTISNNSKEFHTSLPVSIYSSKIDESNKENKNKQNIENAYSNQVLFEQNPEKNVENKNKNSDHSVEFKQSDLINILSIHKNVNLTPSNLEPIDIKQTDKIQSNNQKSIQISDFYQKVEHQEKIVCKESNPLTLVSIQNNQHEESHNQKLEFASNVTIFNKDDQIQFKIPTPINKSINSESLNNNENQEETDNIITVKRNNEFKVSNLMCFEKSIQTSMTKVFGSLYLKAASPMKPKAQLSVNSDSQFYFEENNDNLDDVKSPLKTSRSLENLDSFTIKKEQRQMTTIFGSFSVSNEKEETETNNDQNESENSIVHSIQQKSIKQSIETQTMPQINNRKDNSSTTTKKSSLDTVFGCFEIQSPTIEKVDDSKKETIDAISQTSKSIQKQSYDIITGTNCNLDLSPQTTTASTSTENRQSFNRMSDSFDIHSDSKFNEVEKSDKKDNFSNPSTGSSLSMTKIFGRFDISPGTYDKEEIQTSKKENQEFDVDHSKSNLSFDQTKSFFVENEIKRNNNLSLSKADNDFYVDNQIEQENKIFKPILMVEKNPVSVQFNNDSHQISCNLYSSEIVDINKENQKNLEKLSLNSINIEPTQKDKKVSQIHLSIGKNSPSVNLPENQTETENDKKVPHTQLSIDQNSPSVNMPEDQKETETKPVKNILLNQLSIDKNSPSINLPEQPITETKEKVVFVPNENLKLDQEVEIAESPNMLFEVPMTNYEHNHFDLHLNQSEINLKPNKEIQPTTTTTTTIPSQQLQIQREIVENKSFEIPLMNNNNNNKSDTETIQNHQYEDDKNVEIKTSFPLFFELLSQQMNLNQNDDDEIDLDEKIRSFSITNSSPFYVRSERDINQLIEEEEEDKEEEKRNQIQETDFNSPIFNNIELCKKLIGRQIGEIKSLEKEIVKKDVAFDSLTKKFELFKESTKKMLAKHFGEIRSLNETNAKLVSQIDSLQTRISSKNDAVFSHLKQRTATCNIVDPNEIFSIEPKLNDLKLNENNKVLVTVTIEDVGPSENLLNSFNSNLFGRNNLNRRLFISNPSSYEETGLFANFPLLRESGKITQFSLLPRSSFIPLKVETNLNFEKKEMKPSLTFSFFHLRVTRPKFYSTLHLEDNLTVAHILPQKVSFKGESTNSSQKNEIRRNIERSQFFLPGEDENQKQNKKNGNGIQLLMNQNENSMKQLSYFTQNPLSIEPNKKLKLSSPRLVIKRTQAISFIAQKRQK